MAHDWKSCLGSPIGGSNPPLSATPRHSSCLYMKKYLLEFVVFITGGIVMILELCGSRILAPYVGTSLVVWTSLIGIILGCLSIGYFLGGKVADKKVDFATLAVILFLSSNFVAGIGFLKVPMLNALNALFLPLSIKVLIATILLFTAPSIFLGMVTPIAAKLKVKSMKTLGGTVGNLYAISTAGSIAGTFLAGFVLIASFGVTNIILGLSVALLLLSLLLSASRIKSKVAAIGGIFLLILLNNLYIRPEGKNFESNYSNIQVLVRDSMKFLKIDNKIHSAIYLDSSELVYDYSKYYHLVKKINPEAKKILMIGGGAYSVPKDFLRRYRDITMDVVEIDPMLTDISKKEFGLRADPRLRIYHEDGRTFLNRISVEEAGSYDAVFVDAFSNWTVPFQLATREAVEKIDRLLSKNGIIITNLISAIGGSSGGFFQAEYSTYSSVFPKVGVIPVDSLDDKKLQNLMLFGFKNKTMQIDPVLYSLNVFWSGSIVSKPILTDDFAPVEQYLLANEL